MTVSVRGVSIAPEFTAQDTAPRASCSTDGEIPDVSSAGSVIIVRAFTALPAVRTAPAAAGPEMAAGTTPMRQTTPMSMLTARLFNAGLPSDVRRLDTHIRGRNGLPQARHFST